MAYGKRLTDSEYETAVVALHGKNAVNRSGIDERQLRKAEISLMIDHRLGVDYPQDRREELWHIHQRLERKRVRLLLRTLLTRFPKIQLVAGAHSLADFLVDEYAKVMGRRDAEQFFGLDRGEKPNLPVSPDLFK